MPLIPPDSHTVYTDDDDIIFDASLNQTVSGQNKNKFYRIQVLVKKSKKKEYRTWTRWGRVGEHGQNAILGDGSLEDSLKNFEKKFKDKSGHRWADRLDPPKKGKYTFIERRYENDSDEDDIPSSTKKPEGPSTKQESEVQSLESKLHKSVQALMELIFNQQYFAATMLDMSYDANKLPLGKLSKRTLMTGYERLKDIAELLADPSLAQSKHSKAYAEAISDLSDAFYTTIPHSFGRSRPPIINHEERLKREIALLESLTDMEIANGIMKQAKDSEGENIHLIDRHYAGLGMKEMTPRKSSMLFSINPP